jgi:quercetin dioxygenase-like cupin family protein
MQIRRVVTGHDGNGKAVVAIDEISKDVVNFRKGAVAMTVWSTEGFPVDNANPADGAKEVTATTRDNGTVFRVLEYAPGVAPRNHRTNSVDYGVVLSGEIDMELEGETVHLRAGDVLVQRGTIHNWVNRSDKPCVIAFVLVDARPATTGGKRLDAVG